MHLLGFDMVGFLHTHKPSVVIASRALCIRPFLYLLFLSALITYTTPASLAYIITHEYAHVIKIPCSFVQELFCYMYSVVLDVV